MLETTRAASPTRQLFVFCDGTNNTLTGGRKDTNVLRLVEHLQKSAPATPKAPMVYYDPGVGSATDVPSVGLGEAFKRKWNRLKGMALGTGVYENIEMALVFVAQHYQSGDQLFLFGFSRGAFTARAVGGIINLFGLPAAHTLHLLPVMIQQYFLMPDRRQQAVTEQLQRVALCRRIPIHFVGVWDTVESVGLPFIGRKISNTSALTGKCFTHVRHALALDEHRYSFKPRLYDEKGNCFVTRSGAPGTLVQVWFTGSHCDVGGGNHRQPDQSDRSDTAFAWMLDQAIQCGLQALPSPHPNDGTVAAPAQVHSQLYATPWWALAGMRVRGEIGHAPRNATQGPAQANTSPVFPQDTQWAQHRAWWPMGLAMLLAVLAWLLMDFSLSAQQSLGAYLQGLLQGAEVQVPTWVQWQWIGWMHPEVGIPAWRKASPLWALAWENLLFIPSLGYLIARLSSAAFANAAGLQRPGQGLHGGLHWLGMTPLVWLLADLTENALTALVLAMPSGGIFWNGLLLFVSCLMSIAATVKYLGLAGVVVLWGMGWIRVGHRRPHLPSGA